MPPVVSPGARAANNRMPPVVSLGAHAALGLSPATVSRGTLFSLAALLGRIARRSSTLLHSKSGAFHPPPSLSHNTRSACPTHRVWLLKSSSAPPFSPGHRRCQHATQGGACPTP
eukprot:1141958-Pelagomonas_calceolata.AAC.1